MQQHLWMNRIGDVYYLMSSKRQERLGTIKNNIKDMINQFQIVKFSCELFLTFQSTTKSMGHIRLTDWFSNIYPFPSQKLFRRLSWTHTRACTCLTAFLCSRLPASRWVAYSYMNNFVSLPLAYKLVASFHPPARYSLYSLAYHADSVQYESAKWIQG